MSKIPKFENFNEAIVAAGFGPSYMQPYSVATCMKLMIMKIILLKVT